MSCQNYRCSRNYENIMNYDDRCYDDRYFMPNGNNGNVMNVFNQNNMQRHVHEFEGTVKLAERCPERHSHHTAGVTGEAILINNGMNHVHRVFTNTDFFDHFHRIDIFTGPALFIPGTNKHIHLVRGFTSFNDGHRHAFLFTTQIEAPLL